MPEPSAKYMAGHVPRRGRRAADRPGSPFEMEESDIRGVRTRVWKNAPPTLRDAFCSAAPHGERDLPGLRGRAGELRRLRARRACLAAALQRRGRRQGRPRRHRHAQPAGMAGRLLRRLLAGAHRDAAQCLVDRARSWNTAWPIPAPRSPSSTPSGSSGLAEHLHDCPALERVFVSREAETSRIRKVDQARRRRSARSTAGRSLPDRPLPDVPTRSRGRRHHLLHLRHDREARRARSARTAIPLPRCSARPFGRRATFLRRGEPRAGARSERAAEVDRCWSVPFFPRHRAATRR